MSAWNFLGQNPFQTAVEIKGELTDPIWGAPVSSDLFKTVPFVQFSLDLNRSPVEISKKFPCPLLGWHGMKETGQSRPWRK